MPNKLRISPNERIDLLDFYRGANAYTSESVAFSNTKLTQAQRSLVSHGFRIELSTVLGELTVYNGLALDREGNLLHNEQQVNDSRAVTLSAPNTTYYLEVEFVESASTVDARGFWDATALSTSPPGREFGLNVATRTTPDWRVVTPVRTTEFEVDVDVNSVAIPIAVLATDGTGAITTVNLDKVSTVLEEDVLLGAKVLRVLDSSLFPVGATVSVGGETNLTVVANDLDNNILTLALGLAAATLAGAIVTHTNGSSLWLKESTEAVPSSGEDRRRGLFKGDEIRGSALSASKEDVASRDDLDIKSLKDYIDFDAAQRREMKFGSLRSGEDSNLPPTSFASTRHYNSVGSIAGARTIAITIGDGTTSFGDLNSSSDDLGTIIQEAHDNGLDATVGGALFIKAGSYVFDTTVTYNRPLTVVFAEGVVFTAGTYTTQFFASSSSSPLKIVNAPDVPDANWPYSLAYITVPNSVVHLEDCYTGRIRLPVGASVYLARCIITGDATTSAVQFLPSTTPISKFVCLDSTLRYSGAPSRTRSLVDGNMSNCTFERCTFDSALDTLGGAGNYFDHQLNASLQNLSVLGCTFTSTQTSEINGSFDLDTGSGVLSNVVFRDCIFDHSWYASAGIFSEKTVIWLKSLSTINNVLIDNCDFSPIGLNTIGNTTSGSPGRLCSITTADVATGVSITNNSFGKPISGTDTFPVDFVNQVHIDVAEGAVVVSGNSHNTFTTGVNIAAGSATLSNNVFTLKATTLQTDAARAVSIATLGNADEVDISSNKITITVNNSGGVYGVYYVSNANAATVIGNNIFINNISTTGTNRGVSLSNISGTAFGRVHSLTGNTIYINANSPEGIGVDMLAGTVFSTSISSNSISVYSISSNNAVGIVASGVVGGVNNTSWTIQGNSIGMSTGTLASVLTGISFSGDKAIISSNSIHQLGADTVTGIVFDGQNIAITGNVIKQKNTFGGVTFFSVGINGDIGSGKFCRYVNISSNSIEGGYGTSWGILVSQNTTAFDLRGLSICSNIISSICDSNISISGFIYVTCFKAGAGSSSGITITGNTGFETVTGTAGAALRSGIIVDGVPSVTEGVIISGNSIQGEDWGGNRTIGAGIRVKDCLQATVSSNNISWSTDTDDGRNIYITNSIRVAVYANGCSGEPNPSTVPSWEVAGDLVHFHGNQSVGSDVALVTGSTSVEKSGNHT